MSITQATAWAPTNIALIKHWGYEQGRPARASLSLTLDVGATTTVTFEPGHQDLCQVNGLPFDAAQGDKAAGVMDLLRQARGLAGVQGLRARVESASEIPISAGFASSASGGAAVTLAAARAIEDAGGPRLSHDELLTLCARSRSFSALRSLEGGAVILRSRGGAMSLETVEMGVELRALCCVIHDGKKEISSAEGHRRAPTSPFFSAFVELAEPQLERSKRALQAGDIDELGRLAEADARAIHAVMMTSWRPVRYARDATWRVFDLVTDLRVGGSPCFSTLDAGPNPIVFCEPSATDAVSSQLEALAGVRRVVHFNTSDRGAELRSSSSAKARLATNLWHAQSTEGGGEP